MAHRFAFAAAFAFAAIAIEAFATGPVDSAHAVLLSPTARPYFTAVVEKAEPPSGWAEFCTRYTSECDVKPNTPRNIVISSETWETIFGVNKWVNEHIIPMTDIEHWGRLNVWSYAEDGRGDCKDYVLVKRRKLIELGLPREALLIAIVWTQQNHGHAVLIARTDRGDHVLDNLSPNVVLWFDTGYEFVKRQSQSDPNAWVYIDGDWWEQPAQARNGVD
jgi:predicted transglutaminase-like cysteine proteinase